MNLKDAVSVYVHIPFCPSKCGYCDFNSYAMSGAIVDRTVNAIVKEVLSKRLPAKPAKTVFFGGGTPTYLEPYAIVKIISSVLNQHPPIENCEITCEANPGTIDTPKFETLRSLGVNRISLGAQSFQNDDLVRLGRVHQSDDIERAFLLARKVGFRNINLDLMFGLPHQTLSDWEKNLKQALSLKPEHLSLYGLTIEPNTYFYKLFHKKLLPLPDDQLQTEMYDIAVSTMEDHGYHQYEISNFALDGYECQHNLAYWYGEDYAAYGPGAVECMNSVRWTHIKHPLGYCEAVENNRSLSCEEEIISTEIRQRETIMLGLRLNKGIDVKTVILSEEALTRLSKRGLLEVNEDYLKLTPLGRHYCNQVIVELF